MHYIDFHHLLDLPRDALRNYVGYQFEAPTTSNYPPFNLIEIKENSFVIEMAVAGFSKDDIEINSCQGRLVVRTARDENVDVSSAEGVDLGPQQATRYLHKGIASRSFERKFQLDPRVVVDGATCENGMLRIFLRREIPEAQKMKKIEIGATKGPRQILHG